jgi:hypothetical protein
MEKPGVEEFAVGAVYDRALYFAGLETPRIKRAVIDRAYSKFLHPWSTLLALIRSPPLRRS